ncbi:MAG: cytochrome c [Acidimicrobiia bacterium]
MTGRITWEGRRGSSGILKVRSVAVVLGLILAISACTDDQGPGTADEAVLERGGDLYQQNCAQCHGTDLSGDPDWKTPNEDGSYPPPPHDSSGHTWHHPDRILLEIIRDGSDFPQSRMPAFGDRLDDDDIEAILEFIKSNWGPQEREYQEQATVQDESQPQD